MCCVIVKGNKKTQMSSHSCKDKGLKKKKTVSRDVAPEASQRKTRQVAVMELLKSLSVVWLEVGLQSGLSAFHMSFVFSGTSYNTASTQLAAIAA